MWSGGWAGQVLRDSGQWSRAPTQCPVVPAGSGWRMSPSSLLPVITSSPPPQPRQINTVKAVPDHHDILCVNFSGYKKTISPVISVSFVERDVEMPSTFCDVSIVSRDGLF